MAAQGRRGRERTAGAGAGCLPARPRPWLLVLLLASAAAPAAPLQILGADVPPLIYLKDERPEGFCVDVLRELQRRLRDDAPVQLLPWTRAIARAQQERDVLLVCPKRTPEREEQFHWVGPLFPSRTFFYVRRESTLRIASLEEARALSGVLVPRASYTQDMLAARGFGNLVPTTGTGMTGLRMLLAGREPALVLEERQMQALLRDAGLPADSVRPAYPALLVDSYFAFSRSTAPARVLEWQRALGEMKRDGSFERLYRHWFDTAPPAELLQPGPPAPRRGG